MKKKMNMLKNIIFVFLVVLSFSSTAYAQKVTSDTAVVKGNIQFYGTKKLQLNN